MAKGKAIRAGLKFIGRKLTKAKSPAVGARGGAKLPAQTTVAASKKAAADAVAKQAAAKTRRAAGKSLGTLKPKPNAFKGVQSAGAANRAPARSAAASRGKKILAGTAVGVGAAVASSKMNSKTSGAAVAPKKKPTNVVMPRKAKPVKAKPVKATPVKATPVKAAPKAKAKPRAASFTPTSKNTPLSVSAGKKKAGYVKSKRSLRGGLRSPRGR